MKRKNITYYLLLGMVALSGNSCVRDEILPCPPLQVNIEVKDKNYFNVDKVELEVKLPEDLAFRAYIPTLQYTLRDAATGRVVAEQGIFRVDSDEKSYPVTFSDSLPHGKYILTVWGGADKQTPLSDDHSSVAFHPDHTEGNDLYLTNDTLEYDAWNYAYTVDMERTKGKLIVEASGLPQNTSRSTQSIDGLYGQTDCQFQYTGTTTVCTETQLEKPTENVTKTLLAPSREKDGSKLKVNFLDAAGMEIPGVQPKPVNITLKRNELTVLRYVYDGDKFTIYILVNDNWEEIHGMEID